MIIDIAIDDLTIDQLEQLRDACNRRILEMRRTRGLALPDLLRLLEEVKVTLRDQSKEWYSLERWQWMEGEVRFWLNPKDQDLYKTGWFSIDDLIAWTQDRGVVMIDEEEEDLDEALWSDGVRMAWHSSSVQNDAYESDNVTLCSNV